MAGELVLAVDQGTTSTRAMLFGRDGSVVGVAQEEHAQLYPRPGWVEHDPVEIWERVQRVVRRVLGQVGVGAGEVAAVGVANQRETTVVWERATGRPVYNAIVWQDTRTQPVVSRWRAAGYEEEVRRKTGLVVATYFSGTKLAWYGVTRVDGPLGGEVPVCGAAGDQQAALFGQACFDRGEAKNTYGTGSFLLQNTGEEVVVSRSGLLTTGFYALEPGRSRYALEGSIAVTGAAVQWLRDNLGLIGSAGETEAVAATVEDSGGCYFVPAFSGLFAPWWDERARGVVVGLTRYVTRAHVVRAVLESICWQTRDVVEAMVRDSGRSLVDLRVDGGAVRNDLLMQLQADVLGVPVVRPRVRETTALGAAYLAGLAVGYWSGLGELRENWQVERVFEPRWSEDRRESGYAQWKKAVERTRGWID